MIDCCNVFNNIFEDKNTCFDCKTKAKEINLSFEIIGSDVCRIHVDNCLIETEKMKKCDYVFYANENYYFVELKRPNNSELAVNQVIKTIEFFQKKIRIKKNKINGVVIHQSVPKSSTKRNILKERFVKKYGKNLTFKSQKHSIKI